MARMNDYDVRVAKFHGKYLWHSHHDTDELFLVVSGALTIHLREPDGERRVDHNAGEVFVVPRGVEHQPVARAEAHILMVEPSGAPTTGDRTDVPEHIPNTVGHDLTDV